jgi:hypothetical protein
MHNRTEPFGQIAVRMGFVSQSQVQAALEIQDSLRAAGRSRKLIGMVMLETGMISSEQLIAILKYYETLEDAARVVAQANAASARTEQSPQPTQPAEPSASN